MVESRCVKNVIKFTTEHLARVDDLGIYDRCFGMVALGSAWPWAVRVQFHQNNLKGAVMMYLDEHWFMVQLNK